MRGAGEMGVTVGVMGDREAVALVEFDGILPGGRGFEDDVLVLIFLCHLNECI